MAHEVRTLSAYLWSREFLEERLGRRATRKEWAASLGISEEELSRQVRYGTMWCGVAP